MHLADALAELGALLGLGRLAFNEFGLCRVQFDGELTVDFESADEGATLYLSGSLGALPDSAEICQTLLHANFLGEGTGGAAFAWDRDRGELLLHRSLAAATAGLVGFYLFLAPGVLVPGKLEGALHVAAGRLWLAGAAAALVVSAWWLWRLVGDAANKSLRPETRRV